MSPAPARQEGHPLNKQAILCAPANRMTAHLLPLATNGRAGCIKSCRVREQDKGSRKTNRRLPPQLPSPASSGENGSPLKNRMSKNRTKNRRYPDEDVHVASCGSLAY